MNSFTVDLGKKISMKMAKNTKKSEFRQIWKWTIDSNNQLFECENKMKNQGIKSEEVLEVDYKLTDSYFK